jgi:hypothetical protein
MISSRLLASLALGSSFPYAASAISIKWGPLSSSYFPNTGGPTKKLREWFGEDSDQDFTDDCDYIDNIAKKAKTITQPRSILQSSTARMIKMRDDLDDEEDQYSDMPFAKALFHCS